MKTLIAIPARFGYDLSGWADQIAALAAAEA